MSQITIYLDGELESRMKTAVKASRLSVSKWIANLIREKIATEWPQDVVDLAGSWGDDFPSLQEIRATQVADSSREAL